VPLEDEQCTGCDSPLSRCRRAQRAGKIACCPDCKHVLARRLWCRDYGALRLGVGRRWLLPKRKPRGRRAKRDDRQHLLAFSFEGEH